MRGWAIHLLAAIALIVCIGTFSLWSRSYRTADYALYRSRTTENHATFKFIRKTRFELGVRSDAGAIVLAKGFNEQLDPWSPNYPEEPQSHNFDYGSDLSESASNRIARIVLGLSNATYADPPWFPSGLTHAGEGYVFVKIPTLGVTIASALVAVVSSWKILRRRKKNPDACRKCGYSLTGNTSGICPECGTPAKKTKPSGLPSTPSA